jgi:hypothetical protein
MSACNAPRSVVGTQLQPMADQPGGVWARPRTEDARQVDLNTWVKASGVFGSSVECVLVSIVCREDDGECPLAALTNLHARQGPGVDRQGPNVCRLFDGIELCVCEVLTRKCHWGAPRTVRAPRRAGGEADECPGRYPAELTPVVHGSRLGDTAPSSRQKQQWSLSMSVEVVRAHSGRRVRFRPNVVRLSG